MASRIGPLWTAIVLLAVFVRAAGVLLLQSHLVPRSTYEHGEIAANLIAGRGFSTRFLGADGPTSQQAPVYPSIVAVAYLIGGVETPRSLLILELGQAVLGGVLTLGVMVLARRIAGDHPRAVLAAGLLAALHPTLVYAATHVQVALLGATLVTWALASALRLAETGRPRDAVTAGSLLALTALTDPILGLVAAGMLVAVFLGRERAPALRLSALMLGVAAAGVSPWIARNALVHGEFVAIKSTFGYAFWQGNCAISEGTDKVVRASVETTLGGKTGETGLAAWNRTLWKARHEAGYIDDIALTNEDRSLLGRVTEPERSRILLRRALADLRRQPWRYPQLCLRRLRYFWLFDETNPKARSMVYRASQCGLLALSLAGLAACGRDVRRRLLPLLATTGLVAAFHALTIVSARFHVPLEPLMAVIAGSGLAGALPFGVPWGSAAAAHDVVGVGIVDGLERGGLLDGAA
ncbi:glycosyltransferase family 39 protein [Aquisphaera insulae]|uniref:glycosyltransferase family 39 protein n=1 Tax=Aquisphaera insulae TaxID=2712864 RepID=UPI0013E9DE30|nr:glycosyltransferase family 39 protein [Aquisphaera insulae]